MTGQERGLKYQDYFNRIMAALILFSAFSKSFSAKNVIVSLMVLYVILTPISIRTFFWIICILLSYAIFLSLGGAAVATIEAVATIVFYAFILMVIFSFFGKD